MHQYNDLESALKVMKTINDQTSQPVIFYHMFRLENGHVPFTFHARVYIYNICDRITYIFILHVLHNIMYVLIIFQMPTVQPELTFISLATSLKQLTCDPVETYWLTTQLYRLIDAFEDTNSSVVCDCHVLSLSIYIYILSVYSPFSARVGLPLHNIPSPFISVKTSSPSI